MKQLSFLDLAKKVLKEAGHPMTPGEIWKKGEQLGWTKDVNTTGKTPWNTIGAQMYVSMRDDPASPFCKEGDRPRRFFLKGVQANAVSDPNGTSATTPTATVGGVPPTFLEKHLHPFLTYFARYQLKAYVKTVRHHKSSKNEFGEWVHPDMVGCYLPMEDWEAAALQVANLTGQSTVRLYSFELKRELSFANLRESFFQAVSNSSWANQGYLVAARVAEEPEFRDELGRLSSSFGIGVIALDIDDPEAGGEIVFAARERQAPDWDMINKLTAMNDDFRDFLDGIRISMVSGTPYRDRFDPVLDAKDLVASIKARS